jgi:quinoprotein glucose dehydrogenase
VAVDPAREMAIVPVNRIAMMVQLIPREGFDLPAVRAKEDRLGDEYEYNMMRGTPYVMRRRMLLAPSKLPCTPPPFGTLVAVDLASGARKWEVPLGSFMPPSVRAAVKESHPEWGSPNLGGAIVTGGGLVFIGATIDRQFHAYDVDTGRELWHADLPQSAKATPVSYETAGEQFVAVALGGGGAWESGDSVVAFRLRR